MHHKVSNNTILYYSWYTESTYETSSTYIVTLLQVCQSLHTMIFRSLLYNLCFIHYKCVCLSVCVYVCACVYI